MKQTDAQIADKALEDYKLASAAVEKQRLREKEDLEFQDPIKQWDEKARQERMGDASSGSPTPPRPMISVPVLDQPLSQVINHMRDAQLGISVHPLSEDAEREVAEMFQDHYRAIERESDADQARAWGYARAVMAGWGAWRVRTEYDETTGEEFDQRILIERIQFQESVKWDPAAVKPDNSDANYCFVTGWVPLSRFKEEFPKSQIASAGSMPFSTTVPDWVELGTNGRGVQVAEYWCKKRRFEEIALIEQMIPAQMGPQGVIPAHIEEVVVPKADVPNGTKIITERRKEKCEVWFYRLAAGAGGLEVLESKPWGGKYIPIITVLGKELVPFDGEKRYQGMIRPARDAVRVQNYAASALVERVSLEPKVPWVMAEGQDQGYESDWAVANTRNLSVLKYRQKDMEGNQAPPPFRAEINNAAMGPSLQLLQESKQWVQVATQTPDAALGRISPDRSGKAILALQQQSDIATAGYLKNLAEAMQYEALVILDLIPVIYDRVGRVLRTLTLEGEAGEVLVNQPFIPGKKGERPQPAQGYNQAGAKNYDVTKGKYGVSVTISKGYQTRIEEGAAELGQIIQSAPQLLPVLGPVFFKYLNFPGAKEATDAIKKWRDSQFPALADKEGPDDPQALKAQIAQMEQALQQMQEQLKQAAEVIQTKQVEQQAKVQTAQIDAASEQQAGQRDNQTDVLVAKIKAETELTLQQMKDELAIKLKAMELANAREIADRQAEQQERQADRDDQRQERSEARDDQGTA